MGFAMCKICAVPSQILTIYIHGLQYYSGARKGGCKRRSKKEKGVTQMTKRFLAILLTCLLVLTSYTALADVAEERDAYIRERAQMNSKVERLTDEPVTLTLWADTKNNGAVGTLIEKLDDMEMLKAMEAKTGVHIECICPPVGEDETAFSLMLASGKYPDIILGFNNYYPYSGDTAIDEGIIVNIADLLDVAPHYKAVIEASDFRKKSVTTDLGNMPYIHMPTVLDETGLNIGGPIIRQDLLDKLGMEAPTTYDELHTFLTRCVDELGLKRPMALDSNGASKYDGLTAGYGFHLKNICTTHAFYLEGGKVTYAPLTEGYREYITTLSQWYKEGLIDPDFASVITFDDGVAMITSGECAYSTDHSGILGMYNSVGQTLNPDYNFVIAPMPVRKGGDTVHIGSSSGASCNIAAAISTSCKDPELAMRYIDQWFTDEGFMMANFGVEGKTYEMVDGMPTYTDFVMNNPDMDSVAILSAYATPVTWFSEFISCRDVSQATRQATQIWDEQNDSEGVIPGAVTLNSEEKEVYGDLYSEISSYVEEMTVRFIMGLEPVENYDTFVEQLNSLGVNEAIGAYQAAYDRYMAR